MILSNYSFCIPVVRVTVGVTTTRKWSEEENNDQQVPGNYTQIKLVSLWWPFLFIRFQSRRKEPWKMNSLFKNIIALQRLQFNVESSVICGLRDLRRLPVCYIPQLRSIPVRYLRNL
jgi:hypothetical protein